MTSIRTPARMVAVVLALGSLALAGCGRGPAEQPSVGGAGAASATGVPSSSELTTLSAREILTRAVQAAAGTRSDRIVLVTDGNRQETLTDADGDVQFTTRVGARTTTMRVVGGRTYVTGVLPTFDAEGFPIPEGRWVAADAEAAGASVPSEGSARDVFTELLDTGDEPLALVGPSSYAGQAVVAVDVGEGADRVRVFVAADGPSYPVAIVSSEGQLVAEATDWDAVPDIESPAQQELMTMDELLAG